MPLTRLALILAAVILAAALTVWAVSGPEGMRGGPVAIAAAVAVALGLRGVTARGGPRG